MRKDASGYFFHTFILFPFTLLVLYLIFYYLGIVRHLAVEVLVILLIVVYYAYVDIHLGIAALVVAILWFMVRKQLCQVDYTIAHLNAREVAPSTPIPKIIIQTGPSNDLQKYKPFVDSIQTMNPDYQYLFFNDEDIAEFLQKEYPEYWVTYQKLPILIQRIDFFRYIAVYHYGGIYMDMDMKMLKPFDDAFLNHQCVFPVDEYLKESSRRWPRYVPFCNNTCYFLLGQYAFASAPKHPFIKVLIDKIHHRLERIVSDYQTLFSQGVKNKKGMKELFVYRTTGPDYVTHCFMDYYYKNQLYILDNGLRQHLGNYAKHQYMGSWK